jgi:predicted phage tail protein
MDPEEIAVLWQRSIHEPDQLTEAAHEALRQVISERSLDVRVLLNERNASIQADQRAASVKAEQSAQNARGRDHALSKVMGVAGLLVSAIILATSVAQFHAGGLIAALATAGCSIWLIVKPKDK